MAKWFRLGLMGRIGLALAVVSLVPLAILAFSLRGVNRSAMREQVERTHSVAVRSVASRVEAQVMARQTLGASLAGNRLLLEDPTGPEAVGLLTSVLQSQETVVGIIVEDAHGEIVVRAQYPDDKDAVDRALAIEASAPVEPTSEGGEMLLLYTVGLPEATGALKLVERPLWLEGMFQPEELGRDAELTLLGPTGERLGGHSGADLPSGLVELATTGKLGGAQVLELDSGEQVVSAFWYLEPVPWVVVSVQPAEVAESLAHALDQRALLAVGLALLLAGLGIAGGYSSIVRPVRGILAAQRELDGKPVGPEEGGNELEQLKVSLDQLRVKVKDKTELGRVFLGRYQVLEILGEGAMGTVFRGLDPKLQRAVALKTIHLDRARGEKRGKLVTTLLREAVAAARFSHSNIVAIYDIEDSADVAYVAMELIEGRGLEEMLWERGRLPPSSAVPIAAAVARALSAAHDLGMVHRDIKPANVLLGFDGAIKVTDFGIAGYLGEMKAGSGSIFGTPGYVPPEAIQGQGYDARSDLFSLGVVLYQMLTGVHPFQGNGVREILLTTLTREPRPVSALSDEVSEELEELVGRLLAKKPDYRPAVGEVLRSLEEMTVREGWQWSYVAGAEPPPIAVPSEPTIAAQWIDTMEFQRSGVAGGDREPRG